MAGSRGAVGETTFHVCFLMGTPTHMFCAKRMLKWYPKLLHDIYLSEVSLGLFRLVRPTVCP